VSAASSVATELVALSAWQNSYLGDVVDILDSKRKPITKRDRVAGPYPYYGATGVLDWVSGFIFDERLVLIGEDGAKWSFGDRSAFAVNGKTWVNNHAHVLRPNRQVVTDEWLIYYLNAADLTEFISGMTVPKLNQGRLREIPIPIPPLEEQKRIVAVLDQTFAALDRARALAEANLADAEELFDGWLTAVFHEHPPEWASSKLRDLCHQITVGFVGPMADRYSSEGTPFLRSQNVRPFRINLADVKFIDDGFRAELKKSELRPGDVAIVRTGYPGTAAVIPDDLPLANCADLVIARPKDELHPEFLAMFLNSSFGKKMVAEKSVGAAQKHFNVGAAKEVDFAYPTLEEQLAIVNQMKAMRSYSTRLYDQCQAKIDELQGLRQALLQQAFAGELT
jgi:type I restriction enzyme S subunit